MDGKAFTLGVLAGVAGSVFVYWQFADGSQPGRADSLEQSAAPHQPAIEAYSVNRSAEERRAVIDSGRSATLAAGREDGTGREAHERATAGRSSRRQGDQSTGAQTSAGKQSEGVSPEDDVRSDAPAEWPPPREVLAREPKDPDWSYYMEQTLRQYLASHSKAGNFDFTSIDCRTTFCEVHAYGVHERDSPLWQQVLYDVRDQPWSEFGMSMSTVRNRDGRWLFEATFERRPR